MFEVPLRNDLPAYEFTIDFEDQTFGMFFYWNTRRELWFFDLRDNLNNKLLSGIPVYVDWPVLLRFTDDKKPAGNLLFYDTTGQKQDPGRFDLGTKVKLYYQESSE